MKNAREAHFILMKHQMLWSRTRPIFICGQTNCSYQKSKMAKVIMRKEWFQNWQACLEFLSFYLFTLLSGLSFQLKSCGNLTFIIAWSIAS